MSWSSITTLSQQLGIILTEKNQTISTAESCTGGGIAFALTDISGSSAYFKQSWVTYSNEAKINDLGIPSSIIETYGAVSESAVNAMAMAASSKSDADFVIATSGIAGPTGGSEDKPVGLVWFAFTEKKQDTRIEKKMFTGDRESVRLQAIEHALKVTIDILGG